VTRGGPGSVAFSPSGRLLAVANYLANTVWVLSVAADGAIARAPGSPVGTGGSSPESVAFSPSGRLLAAADQNVGALSLFSVGRRGRLRRVSGSPFATRVSPVSAPISIAFSPSGRLLAAADFAASKIEVFSVVEREHHKKRSGRSKR
jgi:6-phosphogluconolactonase (cycloisomerase 2 family)